MNKLIRKGSLLIRSSNSNSSFHEYEKSLPRKETILSLDRNFSISFEKENHNSRNNSRKKIVDNLLNIQMNSEYSLNEEILIKDKKILNTFFVSSKNIDDEDSHHKTRNRNRKYKLFNLKESFNSFKITSFDLSLGDYKSEEKMFRIIVVDDNILVRQNTVNLIKRLLSALQLNNIEVPQFSDGIDLLYII